MVKLFAIAVVAVVLAACGGGDKTVSSSPTPSATTSDGFEGYSQGVKDYYAGAEIGDFPDDTEAAYHQPPKPAEAGLGETITLTGTNLGIRMGVTVTGVESVKVGSRRYTAVKLRLENTGTAVHDNELRAAAVSYGSEAPEPLAAGVKADCSNGFESVVRLDVARKTSGCLLFPVSGSEPPATFQLALEQVPTTAGGIWNLR